MSDICQTESDNGEAMDCEQIIETLEKTLGIAHKTDVPLDVRLSVVNSKVTFLARQQQNRELEIGVAVRASRLPRLPVSKL